MSTTLSTHEIEPDVQWKWTIVGLGFCLLSMLAQPAKAIPSAPLVICEMWPDIDACRGRVPQCSLCHTSTYGPVAWNDFGFKFFGADTSECAAGNNRWACFRSCFDNHLRTTLDTMAAEPGDTDADCVDDVTELLYGTDHLDEADHPWAPFELPTPVGDANPYYEVGEQDGRFAYRRIKATFCGLSPDYDEIQAFDAKSDAEQLTAIHDALDECLDSAYWLMRALPHMADARIRPLKEVSADKTGDVANLGDYNHDYRLFVWALSQDHDARDLLVADYGVAFNLEFKPAQDPVAKVFTQSSKIITNEQPLEPNHRAGMITSQWFLIVNTMFSEIPRTTAAQALRAYLGMDIAMSEGMYPMVGEPLDVDEKGVKAEPCSHCHATLDPLAYAFAEYKGIASGGHGLYEPSRAEEIFQEAGISPQNRPLPALMGQSIDWDQGSSTAVVAWAEIAANSDAFKRNLATMFFTFALGREPAADELAEFTDWWMNWGEADGYSANELLHGLVDLHAFGAP